MANIIGHRMEFQIFSLLQTHKRHFQGRLPNIIFTGFPLITKAFQLLKQKANTLAKLLKPLKADFSIHLPIKYFQMAMEYL